MHALLLLQDAEPSMTMDSWIFLGLAWAAVISLTVFCFRRVLGGGGKRP